jgi:subtilisin family serine protease
VVGIMDTGIDIDHCMFWDPVAELPALNGSQGVTVDPDHRKVLAVDFYWSVWDWPSPGPSNWDDHGHGSHVAGSVAGDAGADRVRQGVDGMAPAARLVIQDGGFAFDDCADLPGLGCPVRPLEPVLQQAYDQGARLHSNSWGDEENFLPRTRYTERAADVDRFVWEHPDMTVLFAAGNAGEEGDDSVISPATAKNVIAAGATWRADVNPPCPTEWSSRGHAHDGRIKPDVMAPGAGVISAASDFVVGGTQNCEYAPMSGTSMATPVTAGHAALVRQYFIDGFYPGGAPSPADGFVPSAALVKAVLIASAVDISELGCATAEPVPSRDQGWGLIQLDRALLFDGDASRLLLDDEWTAFAGAGDPPHRRDLATDVPGPLKVVLVWTDPPSTSTAAVNLVNDLDLVAEGPDGVFRGNNFADGLSQPGGSADRLNNVEVVWLPGASAGEWRVEVRPHAIREAGQGFALVVLRPDDAAEPRRPRGRLALRP